MDYEFTHLELEPVSANLLNELVVWSRTLALGSTSGFEESPAIAAAELAYAQAPLEVKDYVHGLISSMDGQDILSARRIEVNRLNGGHSIGWHTDNVTPYRTTAIVNQRHRVHLYLEDSDTIIYWRRGYKDEPMEYRPKAGVPFLFNDYVWHKVVNNGMTPRTTVGLQLWDATWSWKIRLYKRLNIRNAGY